MKRACPDHERLTEPAIRLAADWGCALSTVARWRHEHGVVVRAGAPRGPRSEALAYLREHPDQGHAAAARALGITRQAVAQLRERHQLGSPDDLRTRIAADPEAARRILDELAGAPVDGGRDGG
jgi:hypothetical protein